MKRPDSWENPYCKPRYDWKSVDWRDQDVSIARRLGCTRERVRQVRFVHGIAKSRKHRRRTVKVVPDYMLHAKRIGLHIERYTAKEIARILGVSVWTAERHFPQRKKRTSKVGARS